MHDALALLWIPAVLDSTDGRLYDLTIVPNLKHALR